MKLQALCRRTTWEIVRDPLNLAFGLGFPLVLLLLLSAIQANVPVDLFAIDRLTPGISVFGLAFIALFSATLVARDRESALLQRLYTPTSGKITIGGVDIQQIDRKYLRAHVGLILQEPFLYSKSIRENVGITAPEQEAERIEHAADIASASGFIAKADKGWETVVGERGVTLSGGQKQRIAIARTLLKDNNILIFDDSLSAVDTETDAQIRAALRHEQKDVTTLIISHRVTTLSQADLILVLENGQITQQGTHAELCSQPGLYQRINSIQNALEEELTQAKAAEGVN